MLKTYINNRSKNSKIGKGVLDVLEVHLTSPEWATALLPAWELFTESLGEVLGVTEWVLTVKKIQAFELDSDITIVNLKQNLDHYSNLNTNIIPGSMSEGAGDINDIGSNLLDLEAHDQVTGEVSSSLGMVADGGSSWETENVRDGSTDELEGVVLIAR